MQSRKDHQEKSLCGGNIQTKKQRMDRNLPGKRGIRMVGGGKAVEKAWCIKEWGEVEA